MLSEGMCSPFVACLARLVFCHFVSSCRRGVSQYSIGFSWENTDTTFFMFCVFNHKSKSNQQMLKIIGKYTIYFQPLRMFQQIDCHLQGVCIKELQVLSASKYTIYVFTVKVFACYNSRYVYGLD
jgi:hypothetical protein